MSSWVEAVVDLDAIAHNVRLLAAAMRPGALMAVVKADAFGHGAVPVARTALASGASRLGVASPAEALALRAAGLNAPMLCWLPGERNEYAELTRRGVDVSVASVERLDLVAAAAERVETPAVVHLKADTGLSRGGAPPSAWHELVKRAAELEESGKVSVLGVWSHFASSEDGPDDPRVAAQLRAFANAVAQAREAGLRPPLRHIANSAAILGLPAGRLELGRAGAAVYGIEPVPGRSFGLRGAMTLRTRVALVKRVPADTGVGYRHSYVTSRATTLALIPVGYADGITRRLGGRADVLVGGVRRPIVGQVSMDQCIVDAGDIPVAVGDPVVLFGPGDRGEPTVAEYAELAGTIPHEILTGVGPRIRRRHVSKERSDGSCPDHDPGGCAVRRTQR
jgi:alanine racemase